MVGLGLDDLTQPGCYLACVFLCLARGGCCVSFEQDTVLAELLGFNNVLLTGHQVRVACGDDVLGVVFERYRAFEVRLRDLSHTLMASTTFVLICGLPAGLILPAYFLVLLDTVVSQEGPSWT